MDVSPPYISANFQPWGFPIPSLSMAYSTRKLNLDPWKRLIIKTRSKVFQISQSIFLISHLKVPNVQSFVSPMISARLSDLQMPALLTHSPPPGPLMITCSQSWFQLSLSVCLSLNDGGISEHVLLVFMFTICGWLELGPGDRPASLTSSEIFIADTWQHLPIYKSNWQSFFRKYSSHPACRTTVSIIAAAME